MGISKHGVSPKRCTIFFIGNEVRTGSGESVLAEYDRLQEFAPDPPKQIKVEMGPPPLADAKSKAKAKTPRPKTSPCAGKSQGFSSESQGFA